MALMRVPVRLVVGVLLLVAGLVAATGCSTTQQTDSTSRGDVDVAAGPTKRVVVTNADDESRTFCLFRVDDKLAYPMQGIPIPTKKQGAFSWSAVQAAGSEAVGAPNIMYAFGYGPWREGMVFSPAEVHYAGDWSSGAQLVVAGSLPTLQQGSDVPQGSIYVDPSVGREQYTVALLSPERSIIDIGTAVPGDTFPSGGPPPPPSMTIKVGVLLKAADRNTCSSSIPLPQKEIVKDTRVVNPSPPSYSQELTYHADGSWTED